MTQKTAKRPIENDLPVDELLARAQQGDSDCQYWAGVRYFLGEGLPKDDHEAYRLCYAAAEQGHPRAQAFVAYCLSRGIAVPANNKLSVKWYKKSAEQGYVNAQVSLGNIYLRGHGVKVNTRLAHHWLVPAAEKGDAEAQCLLGYLYYCLDDSMQDFAKAYAYYRAAAEQEHADAQCMVAVMLKEGRGVEMDMTEALLWIDRAAANGDETAIELKNFYDEFTLYDLTGESFWPSFIDAPLPLRERTVAVMKFLNQPCYQQMAQDVQDFFALAPDKEDAELVEEVVVRLLEANMNNTRH